MKQNVPSGTTTKAPERTDQERSETYPPMHSLRREIDRLFDDFLPASAWRWPFRQQGGDMARVPAGLDLPMAIDLVEADDAYEITAELPGLDENDIEIKVASGMLTIRGEKRAETEERKKDYYVSERRYGSFQRSFRLPDSVDPEKIDARFSKGVLTITLPKNEEAKGTEKRISIKAD